MSENFIPYARQSIDEDDIAAVAEALRGERLTQGPRVAAFEEAVASRVGARHGVAVEAERRRSTARAAPPASGRGTRS